MNESTPTVPSLLSLSAPARRDRREPASDDGFAEELDAAASPVTPHDRPSATEARRVDSDNGPSASEQEPAVARADESKAELPPEEPSPEDDEAALLSVTAATETLVVETSPEAVLPEEAATVVDVVATTEELFLEPDGLVEEAVAGSQLAGTTELTAEELSDKLVIPPAESDAQATADIASKSTIDTAAQSAAILASAEEKHGSDITTDLGLGASSGEAASAAEATAVRPEPSSDESINQPLAAAGATASNPSDPTDDSTSEGQDNNAPKEPALATAVDKTLPVADTTAASETTSSDQRGREPSITPTGSTPEANTDRVRLSQVESIESRPTVETTRFVSRVAGAVNSANERGGPIEIRLSPPELGALRVSIEVKEGVLTAQLEAETPAARATLLDNLPALRDRLEQQQIRIEKFDVDVRDDSGQRGEDWQPPDRDGQRPDERADQREPAPTAPRTATTPTAEPTAPRTITFDSNGINLVA